MQSTTDSQRRSKAPFPEIWVSLGSSIQVIIFLEGASLGFWGFVAGRRAGLSGWPLARTVVGGLIVGLLVLALQLFLEPGHAASLVA
jgi:hypothetical protein